jgi:hypothetical protein
VGGTEWLSTRCAGCGERLRYCVDSPTTTVEVVFDAVIEYPPGSRPESLSGGDTYSTLYHPRAAFELEDAEEEAAPASAAQFLVLGAAPGREPIPLRSACTVFGRKDADVDLGDPAVSRRHFQVEAAGREFFLRDLGSRNGTFVNGSHVHSTKLVDGDEVRAGSTSLVLRVSPPRAAT